MNILGLEISVTTTRIIGLSLCCCVLPGLTFLSLARLTGGRITLLPLALQFIPMLLGDLFNRFGGNDGPDEKETQQRVERRSTDFRARIQAANQSFDQKVVNQLDGPPPPGTYNAQSAPPPRGAPPPGNNNPRDLPFDPNVSVAGQAETGSQGARMNPNSSNRTIRSTRHNRVQGPDTIPDDVRRGLRDTEGNIRPTQGGLIGDDLFGPASLPGLAGRQYDGPQDRNPTPGFDDQYGTPQGDDRRSGGGFFGDNPEPPRRKRRDTRRNERNDDEIFGGLFDNDGDGESDY